MMLLARNAKGERWRPGRIRGRERSVVDYSVCLCVIIDLEY